MKKVRDSWTTGIMECTGWTSNGMETYKDSYGNYIVNSRNRIK